MPRKEIYQQNPKKHRDYQRGYRGKNPEKLRELNRSQQINNPESNREKVRRYKQKYPERRKAHSLMSNNPEKYPLGSECEFCGRTENLEHGHLDYDYPEIYLTVCHQCNMWMGNEFD